MRTIAISITYLVLLAGLTVLNIGIDNQRMQSRYSEQVIKYEDGSVYNPVTNKSYCEDGELCESGLLEESHKASIRAINKAGYSAHKRYAK